MSNMRTMRQMSKRVTNKISVAHLTMELLSNFPFPQQQLPVVQNLNGNDGQDDGPEMAPNGGFFGDVPGDEVGVPSLPPPPPLNGQHQPQHAHATGPLSRLKAAARYVKQKLTRQHHGNYHHGNGMYTPGAPREERSPVGLEEAQAVQDHIVQHNNGGDMRRRGD